MNAYTALLRRIFAATTNRGCRLGLTTSKELSRLSGNPENAFPSIHIAGTNGKGSVSVKIAAALQKAGYTTGLYTSPHISSYRERIRINGELISEADAARIADQLYHLAGTALSPTFFELTTALAFSYFAEKKVDAAVIETGLGGRLDATNILTPELSVITSISLDHTELLGTDLAGIAREKGGIIKAKVPVVLGPHVPYDHLMELIQANETTYHQVPGAFATYDAENSATAAMALSLLQKKFSLTQEAIAYGLSTRPPCRMQQVSQDPLVVLDVAHNPNGIERLFNSIHNTYNPAKVRIVTGISANKDVHGCLAALKDKASGIHLVCSSGERGVSPQELYEKAIQTGIQKDQVIPHATIQEGIDSAFQIAKSKNELLLICGTFFIMAAARRYFGFQDPTDPVEVHEKFVVKDFFPYALG